MTRSEIERAEQLNDFWDAIVRGAKGQASGLDPAMVTTAQALHTHDEVAPPDPLFVQRLLKDLMAGSVQAHTLERAAVRPQPTSWFTANPGNLRLAGLAAGAIALLLFGIYFIAARPAPVSAEEVVRRAQETAASPAAGGIKSFVSSESTVSRFGNPQAGASTGSATSTEDLEIRSETRRWYEYPNRWRIESSGTTVDSQGKELPNRAWRWLSVGDGKDVWRHDALANDVTVHEIGVSSSGKSDSYGAESPLGQGTVDVLKALQAPNPNVRPTLGAEDTVAGRRAYVLTFPIGSASASAPEFSGPRTIWVDTETYFVLKVVQYSSIDGKLLSTMEVTSIQYNAVIDPTLLAFIPPLGAKVQDLRPKPAPTKSEFQRQMQDLAAQASFPLFVPGQVPDDLAPRQPRMDADQGLQLEYVPPAEADKGSFPAIKITEQQATYDLVSRWTDRAERAAIGGAQGWLRRGFRNVDGTGGDSAAMVLRDGTLISISSFRLSPEELIGVAASLAPVPGGHAPLPNPTPLRLEEIRRQASFKPFLPGYVPTGLKAEPPVTGSNQGSDRIDAMNVTYHSADGAVALMLVEGPPRDPSSMARPMLTAPEVAIGNGVTGRLMDARAAQTLLLWWEQEGTFIALETRVLSRDELLRIAASMSTTESLGQVEPPAARPTATPVPAPPFTVLRPTWLPEQMTLREQYEPGPGGRGSMVVMGFDPRPNDQPHGILMLREMVKEAVPSSGGKPDPEETRETIGGKDVTIISRGEHWITLTWVQNGLALTLTNPYDPPGQPRYAPDQLRRIVESIR